MSERADVWRCHPEPVSGWQKGLGWILAGVTLIESTLAARIVHLGHPILIGVLVASSVPAIFPMRSLLRAPRLRCDASRLELSASWIAGATPDVPTGAPLDQLDLSLAEILDVDQRPELRPMESLLPPVRTTSLAAWTQPGVVSGWRRLANGAPAQVWIVAGRPALYLPARAGFAFLLALQKPQEVIDELRRKIG